MVLLYRGRTDWTGRWKGFPEQMSGASVMGEETTKLTGGLIGQAQKETTIRESYADSYLTGQVTGGLVAQTEGMVQIQNSYTAGYQRAVKKLQVDSWQKQERYHLSQTATQQ